MTINTVYINHETTTHVLLGMATSEYYVEEIYSQAVIDANRRGLLVMLSFRRFAEEIAAHTPQIVLATNGGTQEIVIQVVN